MCLEDPWFESRLDKSYGLMFCTQSGLASLYCSIAHRIAGYIHGAGVPIVVILWLTHKSRNFSPTNFMIGHVRCIYNIERTR